MSMGLGETYQVGPDRLPDGYVRTQHVKFLKLAAAGVNVFVSSGDAGSNPDITGHSATGPTQVEYESSDPYVIAVEQHVEPAPDGAVASETAWAGSGGSNIFFTRPAWQTGVPAGTVRLVPDVSLVGDGNTGVLVILNCAHSFPGPVAGTSLSAPVWAGFCALINEARATANKPFLSFLSPLIYPLLGTACLRDITAGSNGAYTAGAGYDRVTGIGVPNVAELMKALAGVWPPPHSVPARDRSDRGPVKRGVGHRCPLHERGLVPGRAPQ